MDVIEKKFLQKNKNINIIIGNPSDNSKQPYFFDELLISLYSCLKDCGYNINIIRYAKDVNNKIEELCIGIFHIVKNENMPKNYIMYNLEPYVNRNTQYLHKLKNAKAILSIYDFNIKEYENDLKLHRNIIYLPTTYHKSIENMYNVNFENYINKDIDVFFYGFVGKRRNNIINNIRKSGINIVANVCYGKIKDEFILRAKIILITNYFFDGCDTPRTTYLLSKKKCIISDDYGNNKLLKKMYNNTFPVVKTENLIETIKFLLQNDKERKKIGTNGYNYIKKYMNINSYINPLLKYL